MKIERSEDLLCFPTGKEWERDGSSEKDNYAEVATATLKLIVAFLYACRRWMSPERREKRRGKIGKLSTTVDGHVKAVPGMVQGGRRVRERRGWRGELDHDCTARQGIMDTIIRERLEVLVIFLLPRLTRTVIHIVGWSSHRPARRGAARTRACTDTTQIAVGVDRVWEMVVGVLRIKKRSPTV